MDEPLTANPQGIARPRIRCGRPTPREACIRIAGRIRLRRLRLRISQAELARRCGVSRNTIKQLEWRPWSVSLRSVVGACGALQLLYGRGAVFQWVELPMKPRLAKLADPMDVLAPGRLRATGPRATRRQPTGPRTTRPSVED